MTCRLYITWLELRVGGVCNLHNYNYYSFLIEIVIFIFLTGCVLEAGKEVTFNPTDDDFEHQLDLRMVSNPAPQQDWL